MRINSCRLLLLLAIFSTPAMGAEKVLAPLPQPATLEFSGYKFGQSPAADMVCYSGFCKSQGPGGNGRVTVPFSVYMTPGTVSQVVGLSVTKISYSFWEDHLFRVYFQVDCTPLEVEECLEDIVKTLDREYDLTPLSIDDTQDFITGKRVISREFATDSGAFVKIRSESLPEVQSKPTVDIADRGIANLVGSTLSPTYKLKKLDFQEAQRKP